MSSAIPSHFPAPPLDWLEYAARQVADQQLHCVVAFENRVDAARMARAVRLTLDAEPVLGCRFVPDLARPFWERRGDLDALPLCPVIETGAAERAAWEWIAAPLDVNRDLVVQARIFRGDRDLLCIKLDHVAADAGGAKEYAYLLARTYRALATQPDYVPLPNTRGSRGVGQVFSCVAPWQLIRAWPAHSRPGPRWGLPGSRGELGDRGFAVRRIGAEQFRAIRAYARARGASINDVLLAAEFRALAALIRPPSGERLAIQVSMDLRRYLPNRRGRTIANLASALFPTIEWRPAEPFEQTLQQARDAMDAIKANSPGLGSALYLQIGARLLGFSRLVPMIERAMSASTETGLSHPFLSNLGPLDVESLCFGEQIADAFLVGPILFRPGFMLSVSSFRDALFLSCGFCDAANNRPNYERFFDLLLAELPG